MQLLASPPNREDHAAWQEGALEQLATADVFRDCLEPSLSDPWRCYRGSAASLRLQSADSFQSTSRTITELDGFAPL